MIINKNCTFVVYGAGLEGNKIERNLTKNGYNVYSFLDAYKKTDLNNQKKSIYNLNDVAKMKIDVTNTIVIIGISDGKIHHEIINTLRKLGFKYFIFIPLMFRFKQKIKIYYINLLNEISNGNCDIVYKEIIDIDMLLKRNLDVLDNTPHKINKNTIMIPVELLYTSIYVDFSNYIKIFFDKPNLGINPVYELFYSFKKSITEKNNLYFEFLKPEFKKNNENTIILSRYKQYLQFIKEYNQGVDLFIASATQSHYNKKGYFNNNYDGHHRNNFLLSQGRRDIPLKILEDDFVFWANEEKFNEIKNIFTCEILNSLEYPILNPYFYDLNVNTDLFSLDVVRHIYKIIDNLSKKDLNILDYSSDYGYFAHVFSLSQEYKTFYYNEDNENIEITKKILELYRNTTTSFIDNINENEFDIIISLNKVIKTKEEFLEIYTSKETAYCVVIEIDKDLIDDSYQNITLISNRVKDELITSIVSVTK